MRGGFFCLKWKNGESVTECQDIIIITKKMIIKEVWFPKLSEALSHNVAKLIGNRRNNKAL